MTSAAFQQALAITLGYEGGFVDDPHDSGGPTNAGITQRVYDAFRANLPAYERSVQKMERFEMEQIYYQQYWQPIKGDDLPIGLSFAVFDYAVNSGVSRAIKDLQRIVHVAVDGNCGQVTINACNEAVKNNASATVIALYCEARLDFVKTLSTYSRFGAGWKRRIVGNFDGYQTTDKGVIDYATIFANNEAAAFSPAVMHVAPAIPQAIGAVAEEMPGKAKECDVAALKTSRGRGIAIIMAGIIGQLTRITIVTIPDSHMDSGHYLMFGSIFMLIIGCGLVLWNHIRTIAELKR